MIDKSLNWGRDQVRSLFQKAQPFSSVLDIGAGTGVDLEIARQISPSASLTPSSLPAVRHGSRKKRNHRPIGFDIERERFPLAENSIRRRRRQPILEHVKEIFWILDQSSRV